MFEITREEAIDMLVAEEIEHTTSLDQLLDMYEDMAINGTKGYNSFSDAELAEQVEFTFNKIEGVRVI